MQARGLLAVMALLGSLPAVHAAGVLPCTLYANATGGNGPACWRWDLSAVPAHTWGLNTSTCPDACNAFLVGNPCAFASAQTCKRGAGSDKPAPAYQVSNLDQSCYALGGPLGATASPESVPVGDATGIVVQTRGGDSGRAFVYRLLCNANDQGGPDVGKGIVEGPPLTYTVTWSHKAFCPVQTAGTCPPSLPPNPSGPTPPPPSPPPGPPPGPAWGTVPLPTGPQLAYYRSELRALIHFNMATFIRDGDPGCNADNWNTAQPYAAGKASLASTFNPAKLNYSQWLASFDALGIRNAVMTAKHGCGHLLWPTKVTLPDGSPYTYCVGKEGSSVKTNLIADFASVMRAAGVDIGFYYSLTNNFYMNVLGKVARGPAGWLPGMAKGINQSDFERIAFSQLTELWTEHGNYSEIWLDGGYPLSMLAEMKAKLPGWQPLAAAFNGLGSYSPNQDTRLSKSPVRWVGTESGLPNAKDIWSTATQQNDYSGTGDPNSPVFAPPGCDTVLQSPKAWFWNAGSGVRTLQDLQNVYHQTVGRNCVVELDFAINRDGLVAPEHAARYQEFGDWISGCYGPGPAFNEAHVAATSGVLGGNSTAKPSNSSMLLALPASSVIDRVMIQEDIALGQRIRAYTVSSMVSGKWVVISSGNSVGNKRIDLLAGKTAATQLKLDILADQAAPIYVKNFAAYAC